MRNINDKFRELKDLKAGDKVRLTGGREMLFVRLKQTKFIATEDGVPYDVPVSMFEELVEKSAESMFDANTLTPGDFFYILTAKKEAIIFQYDGHHSATQVTAINPVTKLTVRMSQDIIKGPLASLTSTESTESTITA